MIKLDVADYCHTCIEFSPEADIPVVYLTNNHPVILGDTVVRCEHQERCRNIQRNLEKNIQKEQKTE